MMEPGSVGETNDEEGSSTRTRRSKGSTGAVDARTEQKLLVQKLTKILDTPTENRTEEDGNFLAAFPAVVSQIASRRKSASSKGKREEEKVDSPEVIDAACERFSATLKSAKCAVVYTGAGISTAANIPDYRGRDGIWTKLRDGRELGIHDLEGAEPTTSHMALKHLVDLGIVKHVLSQNCDGLHFRSGIPRAKLSEVHGNMYMEACLNCRPPKEYVREFDVTEKTKRHSHRTGRLCYYCGTPLEDTIVHFGERGRMRWPLNWPGIDAVMDEVDLILCLGTSLKVLKAYERLWARDRPAKRRPKLFIVNLQWTPKDSSATEKVHAKCDDFMERVMAKLSISIPAYPPCWGDPLLRTATPLHPWERNTSLKARNYFIKRKLEATGGKDDEACAEFKSEDLKTEENGAGLEDGEVKHENGSGLEARDEFKANQEKSDESNGLKFPSLPACKKFTKEPKRCPSGYFVHTPVFRFVPAGQNPFKEAPTESVIVDEASLADPPEWPSSEDDGLIETPLPGPGWFGKGLRRKKPASGRSRKNKNKRRRVAVDAEAPVDLGCASIAAAEQGLEMILGPTDVSQSLEEPEFIGIDLTETSNLS